MEAHHQLTLNTADVKLSLLVHPDKCKHPQAKEAFGGTHVHVHAPSYMMFFISRINVSSL